MQIHERIKAERLKQDLSEEELANRLNIKRSTYQYWESSTPSVDKIKAVAKALGFDENYFFVTHDEKSVNKNLPEFEEHGTQIPGTVLNGQVILVDAKNLTASYERLIEEKERIIKLMESHAEKAEAREKEYLEIIKGSLTKIDANSKETADHLAELANEIRVEHRVMMDSIDVAAEQKIGTTRAKARNAELIAQQERVGKGKSSQASAGKSGK